MLKSVVIEEKKFKHRQGRQPIRTKILMSTGRPHHGGQLLQVQKEFLTLYTSFHDLINVYSRMSGADNPRDKILISTETSCHFGHCYNFQKRVFDVRFYTFFHDFIHVYSPGAVADSPQGTKF